MCDRLMCNFSHGGGCVFPLSLQRARARGALGAHRHDVATAQDQRHGLRLDGGGQPGRRGAACGACHRHASMLARVGRRRLARGAARRAVNPAGRDCGVSKQAARILRKYFACWRCNEGMQARNQASRTPAPFRGTPTHVHPRSSMAFISSGIKPSSSNADMTLEAGLQAKINADLTVKRLGIPKQDLNKAGRACSLQKSRCQQVAGMFAGESRLVSWYAAASGPATPSMVKASPTKCCRQLTRQTRVRVWLRQADHSNGDRRPCCWPGCPHRNTKAAKYFQKKVAKKKKAAR